MEYYFYKNFDKFFYVYFFEVYYYVMNMNVEFKSWEKEVL